MNLHLMELRKRASYKNRDAFAERLGVNKFTCKSWETGQAIMSLAQAFDCAVALDCSIDEIAGNEVEQSFSDSREAALHRCWVSCGEHRKLVLLSSARDAAASERGEAERDTPREGLA